MSAQLFVEILLGMHQNDVAQHDLQEKMLQEANAQTGMPSIKNFRERKLLKDILELRDQSDLVTYTYVWSDVQGKPVFFCDSIGYGIPYATQYTNPQKLIRRGDGITTMPQADPNSLFSPASAEGTWVMCIDPDPKKKLLHPVYVEPRVITSPFKLDMTKEPR